MQFNRLHKRGFSLMELIVVVVIASLITLVVIGSYAAMKQRRSLRSAAESLNSTLVTARSYAVSRNAWHRVVLQFRESDTAPPYFLYWIDEISPGSNSTADPMSLEPAVRPKITTPQTFPASVSIPQVSVNGTIYTAANENYVIIRFFPDGSSDDAVIHLFEDSQVGQRGTASILIRLFGATAKSKIIDGLSP